MRKKITPPNKSEFIRQFPLKTPVKKVIEHAQKAGLAVSDKLVYSVQGKMRAEERASETILGPLVRDSPVEAKRKDLQSIKHVAQGFLSIQALAVPKYQLDAPPPDKPAGDSEDVKRSELVQGWGTVAERVARELEPLNPMMRARIMDVVEVMLSTT